MLGPAPAGVHSDVLVDSYPVEKTLKHFIIELSVHCLLSWFTGDGEPWGNGVRVISSKLFNFITQRGKPTGKPGEFDSIIWLNKKKSSNNRMAVINFPKASGQLFLPFSQRNFFKDFI